MEKINKVKWEMIQESALLETYRMKVPGGWIIKVFSYDAHDISICFFPDPEHKWEI